MHNGNWSLPFTAALFIHRISGIDKKDDMRDVALNIHATIIIIIKFTKLPRINEMMNVFEKELVCRIND